MKQNAPIFNDASNIHGSVVKLSQPNQTFEQTFMVSYFIRVCHNRAFETSDRASQVS